MQYRHHHERTSATQHLWSRTLFIRSVPVSQVHVHVKVLSFQSILGFHSQQDHSHEHKNQCFFIRNYQENVSSFKNTWRSNVVFATAAYVSKHIQRWRLLRPNTDQAWLTQIYTCVKVSEMCYLQICSLIVSNLLLKGNMVKFPEQLYSISRPTLFP